jgi:DNA-binding NarL/FixJ family response regulator
MPPGPAEASGVSVLIASDDPLARTALFGALSSEPGILVIGQTGAGDELDAWLRRSGDAVTLLDVGIASEPALERISGLEGRGALVIALVADDTRARQALFAGARGALVREANGPRLAAALRAVASGLVVVDEAFADAGFRARPAATAAPLEPLTPRESEVLQLLAQGLSNKAIADRLRISEHTAKFHVTAILGKLGVFSRTEAIVQAARLGLVIL